MTITDRDMRTQIIEALDGNADDYNVFGIVDALQARYGTCAVDDIPGETFWDVVAQFQNR